jgi:hypothetical protein
MMLVATSACAGYVGTTGVSFTYVDRPPPPVRREIVVTSPGAGHVWVAGHWAYQGNDYVWVSGTWVTLEPSRRSWQPGQWRHDRRGWFWVDGHWR